MFKQMREYTSKIIQGKSQTEELYRKERACQDAADKAKLVHCIKALEDERDKLVEMRKQLLNDLAPRQSFLPQHWRWLLSEGVLEDPLWDLGPHVVDALISAGYSHPCHIAYLKGEDIGPLAIELGCTEEQSEDLQRRCRGYAATGTRHEVLQMTPDVAVTINTNNYDPSQPDIDTRPCPEAVQPWDSFEDELHNHLAQLGETPSIFPPGLYLCTRFDPDEAWRLSAAVTVNRVLSVEAHTSQSIPYVWSWQGTPTHSQAKNFTPEQAQEQMAVQASPDLQIRNVLVREDGMDMKPISLINFICTEGLLIKTTPEDITTGPRAKYLTESRKRVDFLAPDLVGIWNGHVSVDEALLHDATNSLNRVFRCCRQHGISYAMCGNYMFLWPIKVVGNKMLVASPVQYRSSSPTVNQVVHFISHAALKDHQAAPVIEGRVVNLSDQSMQCPSAESNGVNTDSMPGMGPKPDTTDNMLPEGLHLDSTHGLSSGCCFTDIGTTSSKELTMHVDPDGVHGATATQETDCLLHQEAQAAGPSNPRNSKHQAATQCGTQCGTTRSLTGKKRKVSTGGSQDTATKQHMGVQCGEPHVGVQCGEQRPLTGYSQEQLATRAAMIDKQHVEGGLGCGALGTTFICRFEEDLMALKITPHNSSRLAPLLRHEVSIYLKLRPLWGKVVPHLLAAGPAIANQSYLMATQLISGRHLDSELDKDLLPQLQQGFEEIHSLGVKHNDLRKENILVEDTARGKRVWVIDFGLAETDATTEELQWELRDLKYLL